METDFAHGDQVKIKSHKLPLYAGRVDIAFFDEKTRKKLLNKYCLPITDLEYNAGATYHGGIKRSGNIIYLIALRISSLSVGSIAHEVCHCAHNILSVCNVRSEYANDEAEAYLVGWLTTRIYREIDRLSLVVSTKEY